MRPYYTGTLPQPPPPHQMYSYLSNLDLTVHGPGPTSDMFKLVELGPHCTGTPPPDMFKLVHYVRLEPDCTGTATPNILKLVHYEARTVGKRAIHILLESFLVIKY